jgi:hypothetical protein
MKTDGEGRPMGYTVIRRQEWDSMVKIWDLEIEGVKGRGTGGGNVHRARMVIYVR